VQHALLHGDEVTGATTFRLEAGMDTGPVFGVTTEEVRPTTPAGDLLERLARRRSRLLVATLDGLEDGRWRPSRSRRRGSRGAEDHRGGRPRRLDRPALRVDRLVRACTPAPGRLDDVPRQAGQARAGHGHRRAARAG
jgi:methionyl-tRNA formyltransferase